MKRKFILTIALLIILLSINIAVFADMDAPGIDPYKASVSNVNGATYYNYQGEKIGTLQYGEVINVSYEFEDESGDIDAYFHMSDGDYNMYHIELEDLTIINEENAVKDRVDFSKQEIIKILAKDGLEISEGPANGYPKTGVVIPNGTVLKAYRLKNTTSSVAWIYTIYNGQAGWICELDGKIGYEEGYYDEILTYRDIEIYDSVNSLTANPVGKIPANTKITDFYHVDPWSFAAYLDNYNGVSGYIREADFATKYADEPYTHVVEYPEAKLYKKGNLRSEVLVEDVPIGTELEYEYSTDIRMTGWIYTTYNGQSGWFFAIESGVYDELVEPDDYREYLNNELIYSSEDYDEEKEQSPKVPVDNEELPLDNTISKAENESEISNELVDEQSSENKSYGTQIILICLLFAITIALTSFVTVLLVNRKNKKDNK